MATLYFANTDSDQDAGNANNWFTDPGFTAPAGVTPGAGDIAMVDNTSLALNTGGSCNPDNLIAHNSSIFCDMGINVAADLFNTTLTGCVMVCPTLVLHDAPCSFNSVSLTGNAECHGSGTSMLVSGSISGTLTFDGSYVDGVPGFGSVTVMGIVSFSGTVTYTGVNLSPGTLSSFANTAGATFNLIGRDNGESISAAAGIAFSNHASNSGVITASCTATFDATSTNSGTVDNAYFSGGVANASGFVTNGTYTGAYTSPNFAGTTGTVSIVAPCTVTLTNADWSVDTTAWTDASNATFIFLGTASNAGTVPNATILGTGSNSTGTVTGLLVLPGSVSGGNFLCPHAQGNLGTFGTLALSGLPSGSGGPLGGPGIEF